MNDTPKPTETKKRFRSPPYPMFDLAKAVERAKALHGQAHHHPVGVTVAAEAWGMKSGDGKVWRAAAALIQYRLIADSGTGKSRKFQVTDIAKRIILDENPDSDRRKDALKTAALAPMIHRELWDKFGTTHDLSDSVIKTYLTIDREESGEAPYSASAADEVLNTYRATLAYAGITDSDSVSPSKEDKNSEASDAGNDNDQTNIEIGNYVQWTSNGQYQFKHPKKVVWISEDGAHLRVHGSMTGIATEEVTVVDPPAVPPASIKTGGEGQAVEDGNDINVLVTSNGRLQITADVDEKGLKRLKEMLEKYEGILDLL
ncbi:MAG TPA: hypothetical protein ENH10_00760 [Bacteroidetes bacterium]|nr:hypothetical protein [Bacteroidota bacterium]HEX03674.1 hypothetical protein [Bacteroidota bacterium]